MPYESNDHARHAHLDNGACLDGTGRTYQPRTVEPPPLSPDDVEALKAAWSARRGDAGVVVLPPSPCDRLAGQVARVRRLLFLLTWAVVLLAVAVLMLAASAR